MRHDVLIALSLASMLGLAGTAVGQQPALPAPPADYGVPITNEQAKAVAAAAVAEAKKTNSPMAFAIVGPAGDLVYFEKMDGAQLASVEIAQGRARTAVRNALVSPRTTKWSSSRPTRWGGGILRSRAAATFASRMTPRRSLQMQGRGALRKSTR